MPQKILTQTLRTHRQELVKIKNEISRNSAISYEDRQLRVENLDGLIDMVSLVLARATRSTAIYIEGEQDINVANSAAIAINNYNGVYSEEIAEVVVSENNGYSVLAILGSIFCCAYLCCLMGQEAYDSSTSGMHDHKDL